MDRVAWRAIVHGVTQNWARLKRLSMHTDTHAHIYTHTYISPLYLSPFLGWNRIFLI